MSQLDRVRAGEALSSPCPSPALWPYALLLLLLAVIPRLSALGRSLTYDELFTLNYFSAELGEAVGGQIQANNHPVASVLAWCVRQTPWGASEVALRLPIALLGAAAAPALTWALWPSSRRWAWLSGGFLALAPPAVLASQQVRGYAPMLLCACLTLGAYLRCARAGAPRHMLALALAGACGLWSHATMALGLAALIGATLVAGSGPRAACRRGLAGALTLGLLLWSPILGRTLKFVRHNLFVGPAGGYHPGPLSLTRAIEAAGGPALAGGLALLGLAGFLGLLGIGRFVYTGRMGERRALQVGLALWALAPLPLFALGALGYGRFVWFAWPAWSALAAAGCALGRWRSGALWAALWLGLAAWIVPAQNRREIHDLRGALRIASQRAEALGYAPILGLGEGSQFLPRYGQALSIKADESETLAFFLTEPAVIVVPIALSLEASPELRRALEEADLADPIVLPGIESSVLVFATRGHD